MFKTDWPISSNAGFCLIMNKVAPVDAIGFHHIRSFKLMTLRSQDTYIPESHWLVTDRLLSRLLHYASMLRAKDQLGHPAFAFKSAIFTPR